TVDTYPRSSYDLGELLQSLGTGEAVVTVMDPDGAPTPVAWTRVWAPTSSMSPTDEAVLRQHVAASPLMGTYGQAIDRESAHEILVKRIEEDAERARRADEEAERESGSGGRSTSSRRRK